MKFKPIIPIPKNVRITEEFIKRNREQLEKTMKIFLLYPDIFLDYITPAESNFKLYFYQRIFLRAVMRFRYSYITAPRAFSKSFLSILAYYLRCMFLSNSRVFICSPGKGQGAQIIQEKLNEIWRYWPLLKNELVKCNMGKDYVTCVFKNGSVFDVNPMASFQGKPSMKNSLNCWNLRTTSVPSIGCESRNKQKAWRKVRA